MADDIQDSGVTFSVDVNGRPDYNPGPALDQRQAVSFQRFDRLRNIIHQQLRVSVPAIVQSFDSLTMTVSVRIAIAEAVQANARGAQGGSVNLLAAAIALPILNDVPIGIPNGGPWSLTFPIQPGDECDLIFSDTAIDSWFSQGCPDNQPAKPVSGRRHNLSDAKAWFGLRSQPRVIPNYSTTSVQLRSDDGTVVVDLAPDKITISAPSVVVNADTATVNASGEANVEGNNVNITARDTVAIKGNTITLEADNVVTIDGVGAVEINGHNFDLHRHLGVTAGGGTSGPVSP